MTAYAEIIDEQSFRILASLSEGPARYHQLKETIGGSDSTCSNRLKLLSKNGLIAPQVGHGSRFFVEYTLTDEGRLFVTKHRIREFF